MARYLLAAAVAAVDTALMVSVNRGDVSPWAVAGYLAAVSAVVALRFRSPAGAFMAALGLATLTGSGHILLLWAAFQAGQHVLSRRGTLGLIAAIVVPATVQAVLRPADWSMSRHLTYLVITFAVFVALPLLVGRYLAQHRRLVAALDDHNRQLRRERTLLAEQARLRERLRISRDMHDSLGRRLSLVSVQAAALEVTELPPNHRRLVRQLADAARGAVDELHELVAGLRGGTGPAAATPGITSIDAVVAEFANGGVPVTLRRYGTPLPIPSTVGHAAYRVVEEGLTNAAKHAPGQPVSVELAWEPDTLLVSVTNPVHEVAPDGAGHGLTGLDERIRPIGGLLDHRRTADGFRLTAMLPMEPDAEPDGDLTEPRVPIRRPVALGLATALLILVVLPAGLLVGAR